jgi:putative acetyltransferase
MSFVAREEGILIGAVLAGHDGRRGYLHHLVVRADRRGLGIGRMLAEHSLAALRTVGIDKCHLFVFRANTDGMEFWRKVGWKERGELILMSKNV